MTPAAHDTRDDIVAFLCEELRLERAARADLQEQLWELSRSADAAATGPTPASTHSEQGLLQGTTNHHTPQGLHQQQLQHTYGYPHEAAHPMQLASGATPTSAARTQFHWHGTDGVQLQQLHHQQQQHYHHLQHELQHNQHSPTSRTQAPSPAQTVQTPSVRNARQHYPAANSTSTAAAGYRRAAHISSSWSDVSSSCASLPAADASAASILAAEAAPLLSYQPTYGRPGSTAGDYQPAHGSSQHPPFTAAPEVAAAAAAAAAAGSAAVTPPSQVTAQGAAQRPQHLQTHHMPAAACAAAEAAAAAGAGTCMGLRARTSAANNPQRTSPSQPAAAAAGGAAAGATAAHSAPTQAAGDFCHLMQPSHSAPATASPNHISRVTPPAPAQCAPPPPSPPPSAAAAAVLPGTFTALSQTCSNEASLQMLLDAAAARQRNSQQLLAESTLSTSSSDGEDDAAFIVGGGASSRITATGTTAPTPAAAPAHPSAGTWVELTPPPALRALRIRPASLSDRYTAASAACTAVGAQAQCLGNTAQAAAALPQGASLSGRYSATAGAEGLLLGSTQQTSVSAAAAAAGAAPRPASLSDRLTKQHHAPANGSNTAAATAAAAAAVVRNAAAVSNNISSDWAAIHGDMLRWTAAMPTQPAGGLGADCSGCAALSEALLEAEFLRELSTAQLTVVQEHRDLLAQQNRSLVQLLADSSMAQQNYPGG